MLLPETRKNEVLNIIRRHGLDPLSFRWEIDMSKFSHDPILCLYHNNKCYYFRFDFKEGIHFSEFSPGEERLIEKAYPGEWNGQLLYFGRWLILLRREIEAAGFEPHHRELKGEVVDTPRNGLSARRWAVRERCPFPTS
jgi:hypothetical protein